MAPAAPKRPSLANAGRGRVQAQASSARRSIFSYSVAASYIAKDRPFDPNTHVFHFNPYNRLQQNTSTQKKKPSQRPESGQDAFFVSRVGDTGTVALAVADGVGGWMDSGVDPADFSHGLTEYMAAAAYEHGKPLGQGQKQQTKSAGQGASTPTLSARRLLEIGYQAVRHDRSIEAGGSTAIVGLLSPDGELEVANLGDSGYIHLRLNAVHACSEPQTHAFNTPYQLSMIPPNILARMAAFGGAQLSDEPRDAEVTRHDLCHGDVLVFASDGVWDNLFNQDILLLVSRAMTMTGAWQATTKDAGAAVAVAPPAVLKRLTDPDTAEESSGSHVITLQSLIATQVTGAAKAASVNTKLDGPFAKEVKRYYPQETWHGGKVDDICVVVAIVSEEPAAAGSGSNDGDAPIKSKL
ncbi:protein phosphatase 2C [Sporothrix brasiliensis 5110]|uniref:Protein phosphatase n=1 Tax=Sporothrix brasiliensis 5110 TaxID=1398154 RepID=A0A0C2IBQ4_9PEZI|nr:protein phosphatase 2C [Sporothrix brasiliensis 5110]KIH86701.1 protein phosphatase 2C [Sporothrix brasiliensis 5110]